LIAITLTLLPSPLFEVRYLTIPIIIGYLHASPPRYTTDSETIQMVDDIMDYMLIILFVTIHMFLSFIYARKPFTWHDGSIARFMY
jgi:hypothetical protein